MASDDQLNQEVIDMVIDALKSGDPQMQAGAIAIAREIPGEEVTKALVGELANLSVTGQIQVLSALADRGDSAALPAVVKATEAEEGSVRIAALKALSRLGDASSVVLLTRTAANNTGELQKAARESLYRLRGAEVDDAILAGIGSAEPKEKVELIRSIGERNVVAGVQVLLKTAQDPDREVQRDSFKVLKVIADERYLPMLVELLMNVSIESVRSEAEKTVAAVARKISDKGRQAEAVLVVLASVRDVETKCFLLRVLGRIGSDSALPVLREALKNDDTEVKKTAVRALSMWPNQEPIEDLLKIAQSSDDETRRILALRGFVRLIGLDSEGKRKETIEMYRQAMGLAADVSEKKMVLSGLSNIKSLAAFQMAVTYLEDKALQQEAEVAVIEIAGGIYRDFPEQTEEVLKKVIQVSENSQSRQRAQRVVSRIESSQR